jgi:hypothetical protein
VPIDKDEKDEKDKPLSMLEVISSVLAGAIGVQSKANKQRDFTRGKPMQFVAAGIFFTVLFLATVITLVSFVVG